MRSSCHWKAPTLPRNVKYKFSGFSGIANGLVELFLGHFDLLVALTKLMQVMNNGEEGSDFSVVNARILQKNPQMWQSGGLERMLTLCLWSHQF